MKQQQINNCPQKKKRKETDKHLRAPFAITLYDISVFYFYILKSMEISIKQKIFSQ